MQTKPEHEDDQKITCLLCTYWPFIYLVLRHSGNQIQKTAVYNKMFRFSKETRVVLAQGVAMLLKCSECFLSTFLCCYYDVLYIFYHVAICLLRCSLWFLLCFYVVVVVKMFKVFLVRCYMVTKHFSVVPMWLLGCSGWLLSDSLFISVWYFTKFNTWTK